MAERTRASVEGQMHYHGNGKYRAGRLRYYFKGDELKDFRKTLSQSNAYMHVMDIRADAEDYNEQREAAVTECWLTLRGCDVLNHANERLAGLPGASEFRLKQLHRDTVRACKSATPTPLEVLNRYCVEKEQAGLIPSPLTLIKGEDNYYKIYPDAQLGHDVDEDMLMTPDAGVELLSEAFTHGTNKDRKLGLAFHCDINDWPLPNKAGYPETIAAVNTLNVARYVRLGVCYDLAFALGWIDYDCEPGENPPPKAKQKSLLNIIERTKAATTEYETLELKLRKRIETIAATTTTKPTNATT